MSEDKKPPSLPEPGRQAIELNMNTALPTVFADRCVISRRTDDTYMLQWCTVMPPGKDAFEQARVVVTSAHMNRVIDLCAELSGHYPQPPDAESEEGSKANS